MVSHLNHEELKILHLISTKHLSCGSLAKELNVSRATAANMIASLRKKRLYITTRRDSEGWFYELQARPDPSLGSLIGSGGRGGKSYSRSIEEELLEHVADEARKKAATVR